MKALIPAFLFAAAFASAAEPVALPLELGTLRAGGRTYEGAKIVSSDAVGVKVTHDAGVARIPFERLPAEVAARFPRDHAAAQAQLAREAATQQIHEQEVAVVIDRTERVGARKYSQSSDRPRMTEFDAMLAGQRVMELQAYIARLNDGIARTQVLVTKRHERAEQIGRQSYRRSYYGGYSYTRSWSRTSRADANRRLAGKYQARIDEAERLIRMAQAEIARLEGAR